MSEFGKVLDGGRYTISVPTYERHFSRFHDFIESIDLYCTDKHLLDVIVVVESHNVDPIKEMVSQFPKIDFRIVTTERSLELFNIHESPSRFLSRVGKFTFQSIKKFGGLLHAASQWSIVLDSETLFVKSFSIADLVGNYAKNPYVFYTQTSRRGPEWRGSLVDNVTNHCCAIMDCDNPGRNYMELIYWFFDVEKVHAFINKHGVDLKSFLLTANPDAPIFENVMMYTFLQYNYPDEYIFVDFEQAWKSTVPDEIAQRYDMSKSPLSFVGADHATYTLRPSEVSEIASFFDKYAVPFFRLEPFIISPEYLAEFMKIPAICCFVSSAHIPWLRKKIAICVTGEFRNTPATFNKLRHLAGFLAGCDSDIYLHGWHHPDEAVIIEVLKPKASLFESPPRSLFKTLDAQIEHREPGVRLGRDIGSLAMFYSMERCFELVEQSGEDYDFIVKLRPDVFMENSLWEILRGISAEGDLNEKSLYIPRGFHSQGMNDQIAIGGTVAMRSYMKTFSYIKEKVSEIYFNPEHILSLNMLESGVSIVQFHLNYALMRQEHYHPDNIMRIWHGQHHVWWSASCLFPAFEEANAFFRDKAKAVAFVLDRPKALTRLYVDQNLDRRSLLEFAWEDLNPVAHLGEGYLQARASTIRTADEWKFAGVCEKEIEVVERRDRNVFVWKEDDDFVIVEWYVLDGKFTRKSVKFSPNLVKEIHVGEEWSGKILSSDFRDFEKFSKSQHIATEITALMPDVASRDPHHVGGEVREWQIWTASKLRVGDGERQGDWITLSGRDGLVSYGPYVNLPAGAYQARVMLDELTGQGHLNVNITSRCGERVLAHCRWYGDETGEIMISFLVDDDDQDIELTIHNVGFTQVSVKSFSAALVDQAYIPASSVYYGPYCTSFSGPVAVVSRNRLYTSGESGVLARLAGVHLQPGLYVVRIMMDEIINLGDSTLDVRSNGAFIPLLRQNIQECLREDGAILANFRVAGGDKNVSFTLKVGKNSIFSLQGIRIEALTLS